MCEAGYYTYALVEKIEKEFTNTPSKLLGSVGTKKKKDFTKLKSLSGQMVGTVLL